MTLQMLSWNWQFEPAVLVAMALAALLYWRGMVYSVKAGMARYLRWWRPLAFVGGLLAIAIALESPVDAWAADWLWAHMLQHLLLIFVAAPLLLFGAPIWPIWRAIPLAARRSSLRWLMLHRRMRRMAFGLNHLLTAPRLVWALFVGDFIVWHFPFLYDLALAYQPVHDLEHLCFLGTGLLFWAQVIPSLPLKPRLGYLEQALYTFAAALALSLVAIVFVFEPTPIYGYYAALRQPAGGLPVMVDQTTAGALMNVVCAVVMGTTFMILLTLWLADDERKSHELEEQQRRNLLSSARLPY